MPWSSPRSIRCLAGFLVCWSLSTRAAELDYPLSIAVTESGVLYLADRNLPGVWKLEGEKLTLFFEGSRKFRTPLNAIRCVAVDRDGKLLAGDSSTRDVYRFDDSGKPVGLTQPPAAGTPTTQPEAAKSNAKKEESKQEESKKEEAKCRDLNTEAERQDDLGQDDGKKNGDKKDEGKKPVPKEGDEKKGNAPSPMPFVFGEIGIPMDIAINKSGDLFVADLEIHRIVKVAKRGGPAHEFVQVQAPRGLCLDGEENLWVVSGRKLVKVTPAGEKTTLVEDGTFSFPHCVAVAADKTAYVSDGYAKCIWKIPAGGKPEKLVSGDPLVNPVGMRLAGDKLFVVDPRAKAVFQITLDGKITKLPMKP